MTEAIVHLAEEILPQVESIVKEFGFQSREEFVQEAIRDKVLELQKERFFTGTDEIRKQLQKKGIAEKEMIQEFERRR